MAKDKHAEPEQGVPAAPAVDRDQLAAALKLLQNAGLVATNLSVPVASPADRIVVKAHSRGDKSYHVAPFGAASLEAGMQPRIVDGCCDESDAKQAYFSAYGPQVAEAANRYAVKVTLANAA